MENLNSIAVKNPINGEILYNIGEISEKVAENVFEIARQMEVKIKALSLKERIAEIDKINKLL